MVSLLRFMQIVHAIALYHLDELIKSLPYSWIPRLLLKLFPSYWLFYFKGFEKKDVNERVRLALISLGPIFIKLGQLLATRKDLLDHELANQLESLTERVPPFDSKQAIAILESELNASVSELFNSFDEQPLASASIAQVHSAELKSGEAVVLKIVRPGIEKIVKRDLKLMAWLAKILEAYIPDTRLLFLQDLVNNYADIILGEINLHREAANTIKFRKNAQQHNRLYHARIHLSLSTRNVMCSERIYGIPVNQAEHIKAQGTDLKKLAENGVKIFFTQVFKDNFFHADMHPGNIFVNTVNPQANQYVSVDCAIAGSLSREDQVFLAQQLLAMIQKNYSRNAQLLIDAGWVAGDVHKEELALRLQKIVEPIFGESMQNINFAPILLELLAMAREFHIKVNPNFLLFQKTLIHIEGLGKQLYPELNVWTVGKPLIEEWIKSLLDPRNALNTLIDTGPELLQHLPEVPSLMLSALERLKGEQVNQSDQTLKLAMDSLSSQQRRSYRGISLAGLLFSAAWFMHADIQLASLGALPLLLGGTGFSVLLFQLLRK